MDIIREELENVVKQLNKMKQNYTRELRGCPQGRLINNRNHNKPLYYHAVPNHSITNNVNSECGENMKYSRKYLPAGDPRIKELARKEYLTRLLKVIDSNLLILQKAMKNYSSIDPADIINSLGRAYRMLDSRDFFCNEVRDLCEVIPDVSQMTDEFIAERCADHREWASMDFEKNPYPFPEELFLTASGMRVRSRGEIIICDRLEHFGIPNRYDQLIFLDNGKAVAPDYSFEGRDYEEFYLEYCGAMDDPEYVRSHLKKRAQYERSGIVPWKNIYYIYSTDNGINVPLIDSVIRHYVIPRL